MMDGVLSGCLVVVDEELPTYTTHPMESYVHADLTYIIHGQVTVYRVYEWNFGLSLRHWKYPFVYDD